MDPIDTPTVFAVRVRLPEGEREYVTALPPETVFARGLPGVAIVGAVARGGDEGDVFTPNPAFVRFLHEVLAAHAHEQPALRDEALRIGAGHVYVIDARTPDPSGEVPREDVIGAVQVAGGVPVAGSYRANPNHALLTARGFFQLGEELQACLVRELEARLDAG